MNSLHFSIVLLHEITLKLVLQAMPMADKRGYRNIDIIDYVLTYAMKRPLPVDLLNSYLNSVSFDE